MKERTRGHVTNCVASLLHYLQTIEEVDAELVIAQIKLIEQRVHRG